MGRGTQTHRQKTTGRLREKVAIYKPRRETAGEANPANTLILDSSLQNWEEVNFCGFV